MKSLKDFCVEKVSLNLNSNRKLCMKNGWKIPKKIGNKLFEHVLKSKNVLTDHDVGFFEKEISEFSNFHFTNNKFKISNFNFLLDQHLENLSLRSIKNFQINNTNGLSVYTKNFILEMNNKIPNEEMAYFLQNSLYVENSIEIKLNFKEEKNLKIIYSLISHCSKNLKIINVKCPPVGLTYFEKFVLKLSDFNYLEEMKVNMEYPSLYNKSYGNILLQSLKSSMDTIRIFEMPKIPFSFFMLLPLLHKCKILDRLIISLKSINDEMTDSDVIRALNNRKNLRELNITLYDATDDLAQDLSYFIQNSKHLEIVKIYFEGAKKPSVDLILNSLRVLARNLNDFYVEGMYQRENIEILEDIYYHCYSLTTIDLTNCYYVRKFITSLADATIQSKYTLRYITVQSLINEQFLTLVSNFRQCQQLERLKFRNCLTNGGDTLKNVIYEFKESLKTLCWESSSSIHTFDNELLNILSKCETLEKLKFQNLNLKGKFKSLFNESNCFSNNLVKLSLIDMTFNRNDIEAIINYLKICPNLRIVDFSGSTTSESLANVFYDKTKYLRFQLDSFMPIKPKFIEELPVLSTRSYLSSNIKNLHLKRYTKEE